VPGHRIDSVEAFCRALYELAGIRVNPNTIRQHLREWCREGVLDGEVCGRWRRGKG
jgi:hypothetical protein